MPRRLPDWPRVLPEAWAAVYVGLSVSTFRARVAQEVKAIPLSERRKGYLREDLDAWVDRQAGRAARSNGSEWMDALDGPR